ncbi:hypothetical protein LCGC14_3034780 [marine sediment metagenome]|uniref:Uncharacterized protein n=1 Tax=marine sediment metagenome TaxID=412755 RepID=A0A0F8WRX6_9ZZZZ
MINVVVYKTKTNERRYRVRPGFADDLIKLLDNRERFWEWEEENKLLKKIVKAQTGTIRKLEKRLGVARKGGNN